MASGSLLGSKRLPQLCILDALCRERAPLSDALRMLAAVHTLARPPPLAGPAIPQVLARRVQVGVRGIGRRTLVEAGSDADFRALNARTAEARSERC